MTYRKAGKCVSCLSRTLLSESQSIPIHLDSQDRVQHDQASKQAIFNYFFNMTTDQPDITLASEKESTAEKPNIESKGRAIPAQNPDKPESGIVYHKSHDMDPSKSPEWRLAGRRKIQPESPHEWLWVVEVEEGPNKGSREIIFSDDKLKQCITRVIAKYNDHAGNNIWQESQVTLSSPFMALIFHYAELEIEAQSTSLDPITRGRLQSLLQEVAKVHDPARWRIPESGDDLWNFRIQFALLWTLFKPGSLVIGPWNLANDLQVFQVHDISYHSKKIPLQPVDNVDLVVNELMITAWMWDWDGKNIVRTIFEFRISEYSGDKPPAELRCYPIAFYEDGEGRRGLEAIGGMSVYRERRANFLQYALDHHHSGLRRYCGDFYGGLPAFQLDRVQMEMGFRSKFWPTALPRIVKVRMKLSPPSSLY